MGLAKVQIYTLSDIDKWKVYQEEIPKSDRKKFVSENCGFDKWIQINDEDFQRVGKWLNQNGNQLMVGRYHPFSLMTSMKPGIMSHYGNNGDFLYLNDGVLISVRPRNEDYIIDPDSPYFRDGDLPEHIDLMLFSQKRQDLEKITSELKLPLAEKALVEA